MNYSNQTPVRDTRNTWVAATWREASTTVLPLWYRERCASLPLPKVVQEANLRIKNRRRAL